MSNPVTELSIESKKLEQMIARYDKGAENLNRQIADSEKILARLKQDRDQTVGASAGLRAILDTARAEAKAATEAKAVTDAKVPEKPLAPVIPFPTTAGTPAGEGGAGTQQS